MENKQKNNITKLVSLGVIGFLVLAFAVFSFVIVSAGNESVILRLGKVDRVLSSGFHLKIPLIESSVKYEIKTQKFEVDATAASQDLQDVKTTIALNFNVISGKTGQLHNDIGRDYRVRIIEPIIQDVVKATTAKFNAEALITKRHEVKEKIETDLKDKLEKSYINVSSVSIVHFDFSQSFNSAIEAKVTAEQRALEAKNKLEQVKFEAEQRVSAATAEAEAIRIQAQAITQQGGKEYVNLKAVEKWNGVLPTQMIPNATLPFINLSK